MLIYYPVAYRANGNTVKEEISSNTEEQENIFSEQLKDLVVSSDLFSIFYTLHDDYNWWIKKSEQSQMPAFEIEAKNVD